METKTLFKINCFFILFETSSLVISIFKRGVFKLVSIKIEFTYL